MIKFKFKDFSRKDEVIAITKSIFLGDDLEEHNHDFIELVYIFRGSGYHIVNGIKSLIKQGDFLIIGYNSIHTFLPASNDFIWLNCIFLPEVMNSLYESDESGEIMKFMVSKNAFHQEIISLEDATIHSTVYEIETVFNDMLKEYNRQNSNYQKVLELYLMIIFLKISRHMNEIAPKVNIAYNSSVDDLQILVLDFFNKQSSFENMRVADIAKSLYISPKYLSNLFKKKTGKNLSDFIHQIKIKKACYLLSNSSINIMEIVNMIGYKDSKFFYSIFKKIMGVTPGEYRKEVSRNCEAH